MLQVEAAIKVAGIHWWYKSRSHAAEMTAGYYNHIEHNGYEPIATCLKERGVGLSFTCIEMSNDENPDLRHCSPEGNVKLLADHIKLSIGIHTVPLLLSTRYQSTAGYINPNYRAQYYV